MQYVSPSGTDSAVGTQSAPTTLTSAISRIAPGGTIYLRGGTYSYSSTVTIPAGSNGPSSARTALTAYPGEKPVLNFSGQSASSSYVGGSNNAKLTTGTGNVFRYDVSHNNIDDGWDL